MTKDKALQHARYIIRRTRKPCFIYQIYGYWSFTVNSADEVQSTYKDKIYDYQEVKLVE